jgi:hypothetical protein
MSETESLVVENHNPTKLPCPCKRQKDKHKTPQKHLKRKKQKKRKKRKNEGKKKPKKPTNPTKTTKTTETQNHKRVR